MGNTNFCLSCEKSDRVKIVKVLGTEIPVKSYICSADGVTYPKKSDPIQLQLSVCPTSFCPANCPFCIAENTKTHRKLDIKRFETVLRRLKEEDRVRGVKITGGEPFSDAELLNNVVALLFEVFGFSLEVSISTNGIGLSRLHEIRNLERIESIHISRHHYDDRLNRQLFGGGEVLTAENLKEIIGTVSYKDIFVLNCMLLRDYINSPEEAHKFLDFAISVGAGKVCFMTCTPINDYAKEQAIPFESVLRDEDRSLLFTRQFSDYEFCHCRDGVYLSPAGDLIEFYGRSTTADDCRYTRGLVYDAEDHLRDGFGGRILS